MGPSPVGIQNDVVRFSLAASGTSTDLDGDWQRLLLLVVAHVLGPDPLDEKSTEQNDRPHLFKL
jgi:hypothetical protein